MLIDYPGVNIPFGTYIKSHFGTKNPKVVFYDKCWTGKELEFKVSVFS